MQQNKLSLSVQYPDTRVQETLTRPLLRRWVKAALLAPAQITLRFVNAEEGQSLNRSFRGKDYATNVLTFSYNEGEAEPLADNDVTQADIILCTDVLQREAAEQNKSLEFHAAHLVIHGVLHAQGYDHESDEEAEEMETLEIEMLASLGFPNPYIES
ncbi:rRNA maturation RNase YbeY [Herminiimonas aquatilis]|uniref:Endoribonuclease YbeY n=1 Tax=Herminiimonas aquatilis TaxID=345342 RepID=A0ABW2J3L4_9BURK